MKIEFRVSSLAFFIITVCQTGPCEGVGDQGIGPGRQNLGNAKMKKYFLRQNFIRHFHFLTLFYLT